MIRWFKPIVFLACLIPLALLGWKAHSSTLGANPIEVITHATGDWTLRFLLITLAITPIRKLTGQLWLIRYRRMFGLFAFFYGTLHFLTYIWLDKFFDLHEMLHDVAKHRFITVGFAGFVLLIPLALTSTTGWIRRLGGKRWQVLHRLIYFSAIAGVIHYWWLVGLVTIVVVILFKRFQASEEGARKIDEWKMSAPIVGKVVKLNLFGQFARTLGTLLQNGVPVLTALKITEQVLSNRLIKEAIAKTREAVTDGKTLAQPLGQSKLFPQLMVDLVRIGEETGDVPGALNNLADTFESELQIGLRVMTQLIEPLLIIVMAVIVGFLLISILLPLFRLISQIHA